MKYATIQHFLPLDSDSCCNSDTDVKYQQKIRNNIRYIS